MKINPESLARASSRHPWRVIGIWGVLFVVMIGVSSTLLGGVLNNDISFTNKPESIKAQDIIDSQFTAAEVGASTEYVIVHSDSLTVDDPAYQSYVEKLQGALAAKKDLVAEPPTTYYDALAQSPDAAAGLVSKDKQYSLISVAIAQDDTPTIDGIRDTLTANKAEGFTTQLAGQATLNADFTTIAEEDCEEGRVDRHRGRPAWCWSSCSARSSRRSSRSAWRSSPSPIALGITALVGQIVEFNLFVTNIISMIGLAVGIDYSLFIVSRFREERKKGFDKLEAIGAAGATANRAVFFSGLTVVLALLGMFIIPTTIFRALAGGAIFVTLVSIIVVDDAAAGDPRPARRPHQLAAAVEAGPPGHRRTTRRAASGTGSPRRHDAPVACSSIASVVLLGGARVVLLPAEQGQLDRTSASCRTCRRRRRS